MTDQFPDTRNPPDENVSVLEEAIWNSFSNAETAREKAEGWLALQMRQIPEANAAVLVLSDDGDGFAPAAFWPTREDVSMEVMQMAESAIEGARIVSAGEDNTQVSIACPVLIDGEVRGAISLSANGQRRHLMRQLQWGLGWVEALLRKRAMMNIASDGRRMESVLEALSVALSHNSFRKMAEAVVTDLTLSLDCEMVALGFRSRLSSKVASVSHAADFASRMNLLRDFGAAMDEAIDQSCLIRYPAPSAEGMTSNRAHRHLAQAHQAETLLTVPFDVGGKLVGAFTFERRADRPFDLETVELCDCLAAVLGPVLYAARRDERWIGAKIAESGWRSLRSILGGGYIGRKIALATILGLTALFSTWTQDFVVTSDAQIEGSLQRIVAAPFEGYVASEALRAGAVVAAGDVLARLDDRDLQLERLRWTTAVRQKETEYSRALSTSDRVEASVIQAQIEQARAQISLVDEQIARTVVSAPLDGVIVSGDLSQMIGASVSRGQPLFTIAPLDDYRVILSVDERDTAELSPGQQGQVLVAALPDQPLSYEISRITPVNQFGEGRNFFRVEASLTTSDDALRPGMKGIGKTSVERRLVIANWTRGMRDWLRTALWRWKLWNG